MKRLAMLLTLSAATINMAGASQDDIVLDRSSVAYLRALSNISPTLCSLDAESLKTSRAFLDKGDDIVRFKHAVRFERTLAYERHRQYLVEINNSTGEK